MFGSQECVFEPHVEHMKYSQIPAALATVEHGFKVDPLNNYLVSTPKPSTSTRVLGRAKLAAIFAGGISRKAMLTVDEGDAFALFAPSGKDRNVIRRIILSLLERWDIYRSAEQRKRWREFQDKQNATVKTVFGDSVQEMFYLAVLVTTPKKQGLGYGSMLVSSVTAKADAAGRATWLVSSNVDNTGFYEYCGFSVVGEFTLGENNPTWSKPPLIIRVMRRMPQLQKPRIYLTEKTGRH